MIRILVLIGQDKYLEPLSRFFQENSYQYRIVNTASDPGNVFSVITRNLGAAAYDLIICDYYLAQYPVTEFTALFKGIPLLVMAEKETSRLLGKALEQGAANYIIKEDECYFLSLLPHTIAHTLTLALCANRQQEQNTEAAGAGYILQELPDIVYKIDSGGYFTYLNKAVKILGYAPGDLIGKHLKAIIHPDDCAKLSGQPAFSELRLRPAAWNNGSAPVVWAAFTLLGELGAGSLQADMPRNPLLPGSAGIIHIITERKKYQALILKLYKVMHQSPVSILITDSKGKIDYINPCFLSSSGFKYSGIIHKSIDLVKTEKIIPGNYHSYSDIMRNTESWQGEILSVKQQGSVFWESVFIHPLYNLEENISNYLIIKINIDELKAAQDVLKTINDELDKRVSIRTMELEKTNRELQQEMEERKKAEAEQKKLEAQLFQSQKMETIGTLAGGIAHDFNNILTPILGFANIAMMIIGEGNKGFAEIKEILQAARYARELVQQLLTFASVVEPERVPLDIVQLVKESLNMIRISLPSTIEIRTHSEIDSAWILANASQVHQVFMNLCANAAFAMKNNYGILDIRLSAWVIDEDLILETAGLHKGKYIRLDIHDTGEGIRNEIIGRIFDPFFTTKNKKEGIGLGLSVVHGIVTSHGGKITVSSLPESGTTFTLYFPACEGKADNESRVNRECAQGSERILLVDDEEKVGITIEKMLKIMGYKVTRFTSGLDALREFETHPGEYELLITDYTMPYLTGLELIREIYKRKPGMPVLLTTGYGDSIDKKENSTLLKDKVIMKPFSLDEISLAIRKVLTLL